MWVLIYYNYSNVLNFYNVILFLFINILILNSLLAYSMRSPIYSLLLLIINYMIGGFLFISNGFVFVGLIFILIYVGAISVLLTLTLMLLNLRLIYYKNSYKFNVYYICLVLTFLQFIMYKFFEKKLFLFDSSFYINWFKTSFLKSDAINLGFELYVNNSSLIILISFLLTFTLIGSVCVVNSFKGSKKQLMFKQSKKYSKILNS